VLHVHRSESATALVAGLADVLRAAPPDPFGADLVAVGAKGTERWIAQRLSHHLGADGAGDGICARVDFTSPAELLDAAVAAASPGHAEAVERWGRDRLTWHVLDVLDDLAGDAADARFDVLRHHLRTVEDGGSPRVRRVAAAERLAGLLGRYAAARPELLPHWAAGADTGLDGAELPADLRWQPELFRRVREHVDAPSPAELLPEACRVLRAEPGTTDLPDRLSVFVVTRLATARLQVLAALAEHRDTHLWLQHASPALWESLRRSAPAERRRGPAEEVAQATVSHPLLLSLARDVRELQVRLAALAPGAEDRHHPGPEPRPTLLGALQRDLAHDRPRTGSGGPERHVLAVGDASVQVHACHGRARQVEVLREVVLGLLDDDPTLQPRDVLVMCPDVETFAPLVTAVFSTDSHPGGGLRVTVADRSPLQTNPLLSVAARLLELAAGRVTATDVLDLAGTSAVRLRFGFDDEALEQVREWTVDAGVHWGLGPGHRGGWELGDLGQGSWRAGLDRVLVGVALGGGDGDVLLAAPDEVRTGGGAPGDPVVPLGDVESSRVDLAGRFAELLDRLDAVVTAFAGRHPVPHWCDALLEGVLSLTDTPRDGSWQLAQLRRELGAVREDAARAGAARVGLTDVGALLADRLAGRPQRSSFRTGAMTVCTMTPMRSVPHRVVCLLGLDDGAFPRVTTVDGDDLLARDPQVGDRDPRSEDRQVLLDAVGAAEQHLVLTYSGHDVRTGASLPPAVPVGELLDALDATATTADGRSVREHVVVHHPLQPTDARNFTPGSLGRAGPRSYDVTAWSGALAARRPPAPVPAFLATALPAREDTDVDLDRLVQFWQHPARGLLRQRLEIAGTVRADEPENALPVQLDALQEWAIGDRCLAARLAGVDALTLARVETARGDLPPGVLGTTLLRAVGARVDRLVAAAAPFAGVDQRAVDVELDLPGGTRLTGVVGGVRTSAADGDVALTTTYSRVRGRQRLRAWIDLLALTAAHPAQPWTAVVVGRGSRDATAVVTLGPVDPADARAALADLVALRRVGLSTPLPLPVGTAFAWASARHRGRAPGAAAETARTEWTSGWSFPREDADEEHVLVWGPAAPLETLLEWVPPAGAPAGTPRSFAELTARVWRPLLDAQRQEER